MNTLTALKRCSLGLDLYLWLTYRTFALKRSAAPLLATGVPSVRTEPVQGHRIKHRIQMSSAARSLRELKKIKLAWPDLNYSTAPGVLILHPSTPAIAPRIKATTASPWPLSGPSAAFENRVGLSGVSPRS